MNPSDLTAVLLCGGKGERLRPFTEHLPKPLVPVGGEPLVHHLLRHLHAGGIGRFILCTGYKAEAMEEYAARQADPSWRIECVNSGDAPMADRILDARRRFEGPALICYGDTLCNVSPADLASTHAASGAAATVTVYPLHSPFGIVRFGEDLRVTAFEEKPVLPHWINIGFLLCSPEALDYLTPGENLDGLLGRLAARRRLGVHRHRGKHITVNTENERRAAEGQMAEFHTLIGEQRI